VDTGAEISELAQRSNSPFLRNLVVDEDTMMPMDDIPWLGFVVLVSSSTLTLSVR